jgi:hypothetical protein
MDLEDLFTGGHRRKYDRHDKHNHQNKYRDHDSDHDSDDGDDHRGRAYSSRGRGDEHREPAYREHRSDYRSHREHGALRTIKQLSTTLPHFKMIVAILAVGLVLVILVGGAVAVMLLPMLGRALGFVSQNGVQGAVDSVIPPGGVKGAIESVVPATGLKGVFDSVVAFLQSIWYGKAS